jgi:hypothetical protein
MQKAALLTQLRYWRVAAMLSLQPFGSWESHRAKPQADRPILKRARAACGSLRAVGDAARLDVARQCLPARLSGGDDRLLDPGGVFNNHESLGAFLCLEGMDRTGGLVEVAASRLQVLRVFSGMPDASMQPRADSLITKLT